LPIAIAIGIGSTIIASAAALYCLS